MHSQTVVDSSFRFSTLVSRSSVIGIVPLRYLVPVLCSRISLLNNFPKANPVVEETMKMEKAVKFTCTQELIRRTLNSHLMGSNPSRNRTNPTLSILQRFRSYVIGDTLYSFLQSRDNFDYGSSRNSLEMDLPASEDSKNGDAPQFLFAEYCGFFAIGVSMMWTW